VKKKRSLGRQPSVGIPLAARPKSPRGKKEQTAGKKGAINSSLKKLQKGRLNTMPKKVREGGDLGKGGTLKVEPCP